MFFLCEYFHKNCSPSITVSLVSPASSVSTPTPTYSKSMTHHVGKLTITMYAMPMVMYVIPLWGYLATTHKQKLQSLLPRFALGLQSPLPNFEPHHSRSPTCPFPECHCLEHFLETFTAAVPTSRAIPPLAPSVNTHLCQVILGLGLSKL